MLDLKVTHDNTALHQELLQDIRSLAVSALTATTLMERVSQCLHEKLIRYNWVGFYLVDSFDPEFLLVGPYVGSFNHPAPNARIPFTMGLCGAAASTGQTVVVNDVSKDPRYVAGLSIVKSEIVVPVFANKKFVAELDVNSYFEGTFDQAEQEFLEACAAIIGEHLARLSSV